MRRTTRPCLFTAAALTATALATLGCESEAPDGRAERALEERSEYGEAAMVQPFAHGEALAFAEDPDAAAASLPGADPFCDTEWMVAFQQVGGFAPGFGLGGAWSWNTGFGGAPKIGSFFVWGSLSEDDRVLLDDACSAACDSCGYDHADFAVSQSESFGAPTSIPRCGCTQAPTDPPSTWTCDDEYYDAQDNEDGCDCGCGAFDPDCENDGWRTYGCSGDDECFLGSCV